MKIVRFACLLEHRGMFFVILIDNWLDYISDEKS